MVKPKKKPRKEPKEVEESQTKSTENQQQEPEQVGEDSDNENETEEFITDKIVNQRTNKFRKYPHAKYEETLYRVSWYNFQTKDVTWEPIAHLPQSKVLSYTRSKKLEVPSNIDDSDDG